MELNEKDFIENLLQSLENIFDHKTISTQDINLRYWNFLRFQDRFNNVKHVALLVSCCLKYIDILSRYFESMPELATKSNRTQMCKLFGILNTIGGMPCLKNCFLDQIIICLLERITDPSIKTLCGKELTRNLNLILHNSDRVVREDIVESSARIHLYKLADLICSCGDYEYQCGLMETIFRMCSIETIKKYASEFFPEMESLQRGLLQIDLKEFDKGLRLFLNTVNAIHRNVFSVNVLSAFLDEVLIIPPLDGNGNRELLWVDFNILCHSTSIYCDKESFKSSFSQGSQEEGWELVTIFNTDVSKVTVNKISTANIQTTEYIIEIYLTSSCHHMFTLTPDVPEAQKLKLKICDIGVINELKTNILPIIFQEKYEGYYLYNQQMSSDNSYYTANMYPSVYIYKPLDIYVGRKNHSVIISDTKSSKSFTQLLKGNEEYNQDISRLNIQREDNFPDSTGPDFPFHVDRAYHNTKIIYVGKSIYMNENDSEYFTAQNDIPKQKSNEMNLKYIRQFKETVIDSTNDNLYENIKDTWDLVRRAKSIYFDQNIPVIDLTEENEVPIIKEAIKTIECPDISNEFRPKPCVVKITKLPINLNNTNFNCDVSKEQILKIEESSVNSSVKEKSVNEQNIQKSTSMSSKESNNSAKHSQNKSFEVSKKKKGSKIVDNLKTHGIDNETERELSNDILITKDKYCINAVQKEVLSNKKDNKLKECLIKKEIIVTSVAVNSNIAKQTSNKTDKNDNIETSDPKSIIDVDTNIQGSVNKKKDYAKSKKLKPDKKDQKIKKKSKVKQLKKLFNRKRIRKIVSSDSETDNQQDHNTSKDILTEANETIKIGLMNKDTNSDNVVQDKSHANFAKKCIIYKRIRKIISSDSELENEFCTKVNSDNEISLSFHDKSMLKKNCSSQLKQSKRHSDILKQDSNKHKDIDVSQGEKRASEILSLGNELENSLKRNTSANSKGLSEILMQGNEAIAVSNNNSPKQKESDNFANIVGEVNNVVTNEQLTSLDDIFEVTTQQLSNNELEVNLEQVQNNVLEVMNKDTNSDNVVQDKSHANFAKKDVIYKKIRKIISSDSELENSKATNSLKIYSSSTLKETKEHSKCLKQENKKHKDITLSNNSPKHKVVKENDNLTSKIIENTNIKNVRANFTKKNEFCTKINSDNELGMSLSFQDKSTLKKNSSSQLKQSKRHSDILKQYSKKRKHIDVSQGEKRVSEIQSSGSELEKSVKRNTSANSKGPSEFLMQGNKGNEGIAVSNNNSRKQKENDNLAIKNVEEINNVVINEQLTSLDDIFEVPTQQLTNNELGVNLEQIQNNVLEVSPNQEQNNTYSNNFKTNIQENVKSQKEVHILKDVTKKLKRYPQKKRIRMIMSSDSESKNLQNTLKETSIDISTKVQTPGNNRDVNSDNVGRSNNGLENSKDTNSMKKSSSSKLDETKKHSDFLTQGNNKNKDIYLLSNKPPKQKENDNQTNHENINIKNIINEQQTNLDDIFEVATQKLSNDELEVNHEQVQNNDLNSSNLQMNYEENIESQKEIDIVKDVTQELYTNTNNHNEKVYDAKTEYVFSNSKKPGAYKKIQDKLCNNQNNNIKERLSQSDTSILMKSRKKHIRKLYNPHDLSYLNDLINCSCNDVDLKLKMITNKSKTEQEKLSSDFENDIPKIIVTSALIHTPNPSAFSRKSKPTSIFIKNRTFSNENLDLITVDEGITNSAAAAVNLPQDVPKFDSETKDILQKNYLAKVNEIRQTQNISIQASKNRLKSIRSKKKLIIDSSDTGEDNIKSITKGRKSQVKSKLLNKSAKDKKSSIGKVKFGRGKDNASDKILTKEDKSKNRKIATKRNSEKRKYIYNPDSSRRMSGEQQKLMNTFLLGFINSGNASAADTMKQSFNHTTDTEIMRFNKDDKCDSIDSDVPLTKYKNRVNIKKTTKTRNKKCKSSSESSLLPELDIEKERVNKTIQINELTSQNDDIQQKIKNIATKRKSEEDLELPKKPKILQNIVIKNESKVPIVQQNASLNTVQITPDESIRISNSSDMGIMANSNLQKLQSYEIMGWIATGAKAENNSQKYCLKNDLDLINRNVSLQLELLRGPINKEIIEEYNTFVEIGDVLTKYYNENKN